MKNELKRTAAVDTAKKAAPAVASVEKTVSAKEEKATVKTAPVNTVEKKAEKTEETAAGKTAEKTEKAVKATAKAATTKTAAATAKTAAAKAPAKKAPVKKAVVKETVYLQYLGKEINQDDIMKQVKEIWTKELKNKVADMKSVTLYLKPEENAAYYVVNDEVTGKINL